MCEERWNDAAFENLMQDTDFSLPPEEIVATVAPGKKAFRRVLWGLGLTSLTLNMFGLQYILPAVGMLLLLLGFRTLRQENKAFRACYVLTTLRTALVWAVLVMNTTILPERLGKVYEITASALSTGLTLIMLLLLWRALRAVKENAGLGPKVPGATALILWYGILILLGLIRYQGIILPLMMMVGYGFILKNLHNLSKTMESAGYAMHAAPVRWGDGTVAVVLAAILLLACAGGYVFGGSYPMDFQPVESTEAVSDIKNDLLDLGFPDYVFNDLTEAEIRSLQGAKQVLVDVNHHPVNDGRTVTRYQSGDPYTLREPGYSHTTVYDVRELQLTFVGVELPGERESWMILQHFLWTTDPGFIGTESIQLWPAYQHSEGWGWMGPVTGRVLVDKGDEAYAAPYWFLGDRSYRSDSLFWDEMDSTDVFAAFSLPNSGANHRGYLMYPIQEMRDGFIVDCWFNYTHQRHLWQYPVQSAMHKRIQNSWREAGAFLTVQDALQFYHDGTEARLLSDH